MTLADVWLSCFFCFCFFVKNETGLPAFKLTKIEYLCNFKQDNSVTQIRKNMSSWHVYFWHQIYKRFVFIGKWFYVFISNSWTCLSTCELFRTINRNKPHDNKRRHSRMSTQSIMSSCVKIKKRLVWFYGV